MRSVSTTAVSLSLSASSSSVILGKSPVINASSPFIVARNPLLPPMASATARSHGTTNPTTNSLLMVPTATGPVTHLTAADSAAIDEQLMAADGPYRYTLEQLMELAGLAVAQAVYDFAHRMSHATTTTRILVVCGPGNNGGDGIVAARHLAEFYSHSNAGATDQGMRVEMYVPKKSEKQPHLAKLLYQAAATGVVELDGMPSAADLRRDRAIIIDAILGFGSKGALREPFIDIVKVINAATRADEHGGTSDGGECATVCCVDIPSGWDVDNGFVKDAVAIEKPAMLVSLTLPKIGVKSHFSSADRDVAHYIGGRFVPMALAKKFDMPRFTGFHQVVRLTGASEQPKDVADTAERTS
jgi:hydroxyethylthiazole kinase-like uncharacterized protein yjeF